MTELSTTAAVVIAHIDHHLSAHGAGRSHESWYVGVTNDPDRRRREHEAQGANTAGWYDVPAESEETARTVESHYLELGCRGGTGGGLNPTWVYVF